MAALEVVEPSAHSALGTGPEALVTVAVVSWNTRELLRRCLLSLDDEQRAGIVETWVVDNASSDGSPEMVKSVFPQVRLVASPTNLGFGRAVNLVAERTSTPWLAIANADVAVRPGWLEPLLDAAARDPAAGALAPRLVLPDGSTQHSVFGFPTLPLTALLNSGLPRASAALSDRLAVVGRWNPDRARRVPWAIAAFLLVRREAWGQAGGFDPDQWMYAEDLDLGWRLRRARWFTRYEPRSQVDHHSAASTTQSWGDGVTQRWQTSTYAWIARRRGPARARATAAVNVAGCLARYALLTPAARVSPNRWGARHQMARTWAGIHSVGLRPRRDLEQAAGVRREGAGG